MQNLLEASSFYLCRNFFGAQRLSCTGIWSVRQKPKPSTFIDIPGALGQGYLAVGNGGLQQKMEATKP